MKSQPTSRRIITACTAGVQVAFEGTSGSWSNYRAMVDATGPLAFDGKLRGRAVFSYQDNDHFYKLANDSAQRSGKPLQGRPELRVGQSADWRGPDARGRHSGQRE
ncbi:MAG: hypothetical protein WDO68_17930 [Gammaproteobacteria bacterium]